MKEALENWFRQIPAPPGLLACGVRFPDRTCLSRSHHREFSVERVEAAWHQVAETAAAFSQHRIAATRLCWRYDRGRLHCAARGDGICLGLFVTEAVAADVVERWLGEFVDLPEAGRTA